MIINDRHISRNIIECSVLAEECMQHNPGWSFFKQCKRIDIVVRIGFRNADHGQVGTAPECTGTDARHIRAGNRSKVGTTGERIRTNAQQS